MIEKNRKQIKCFSSNLKKTYYSKVLMYSIEPQEYLKEILVEDFGPHDRNV